MGALRSHTHTLLKRKKGESLARKPTTYHLHNELLSTEGNIQWIIYELICNEHFNSHRKHKLAAQPCLGWWQGTRERCSCGKKTFSRIHDELRTKKAEDKNPIPSKHQPSVLISWHTLWPHWHAALAHAIAHLLPGDRHGRFLVCRHLLWVLLLRQVKSPTALHLSPNTLVLC